MKNVDKTHLPGQPQKSFFFRFLLGPSSVKFFFLDRFHQFFVGFPKIPKSVKSVYIELCFVENVRTVRASLPFRYEELVRACLHKPQHRSGRGVPRQT